MILYCKVLHLLLEHIQYELVVVVEELGSERRHTPSIDKGDRVLAVGCLTVRLFFDDRLLALHGIDHLFLVLEEGILDHGCSVFGTHCNCQGEQNRYDFSHRCHLEWLIRLF